LFWMGQHRRMRSGFVWVEIQLHSVTGLTLLPSNPCRVWDP
jgi:hypothetical protein